ncbi:MAG: Gfo/Idh/MocA family oxidoreductase [Acidobacteria bacterium]|nr:Gfo/Idh/MocA family oxidoreductase [Acidobacteriota bacterium]
MQKHNVGILGYGWVATAHIDAINATGRAQVTAVCSARPLDAAELSARHKGRIVVHRDLAEMLADPSIDIVSLCGYPDQHAREAIAVAEARKHLIIEKPIALTLEDCYAIADAVAAAGVRSCVCLECRWSSQFLATKAVVDAGLLGDLHYGEVDYYHGSGPWYGQYRWNITKARGGSSLLSAGCHALDALLLCLGTDVEVVSSMATRSKSPYFSPYEYPTTTVTLLQFASGRVGKVASVIDCLQPYYFHTHLVGSEGSLLDNKFHSMTLPGLNKDKWSDLSMKLLGSGDVADHPYKTQFDAFFDALDRGQEMPLTSLADSIKTFEVIFAADRSAEERRPVRLDEVRRQD